MIKKIYLEVDEEITSAIDKIQNVEEEDISLVFPKESNLLQSVVNLKLIKKQAEELGKNISVITTNKVGRNLAEQVGLSVSDTMVAKKEEPKETRKEEEQDKVLIEFREEPKEQKEEKEPVAFRKETIDDDEIQMKEDEEIGTLKDEEKEEKAEEEAKEKKEIRKVGTKSPLKTFGILFLAFMLVILTLGYIYIPKAEVTVTVASEKKKVEADITVDKNEKATDIEKGIVTAELLEIEKEESKKFDSTGKKDIGTKATGTIKVSNTYSTTQQTLVAGSRFAASNGLIFKSTAAANVPGYSDPGGGTIAGTVNVAVEAENPGANYNVASGSFTIPAFQGTDKYSKIIGSSSNAMSGGETKEVKVTTASDISKAKSDLSKETLENAKKELLEKAKGKVLKDEAIKIETVSNTSSVEVGAEAEQFTIKVKVQAKGLAYNEEDLKKSYEKQAELKGGGIKKVVESGYDEAKVSFSKVDFTTGSFIISFQTDAFYSAVFDISQLSDEISGQTKESSEKYLLGLEGVKDAKIKFWPGFIKRVPRVKKNIKVKMEAASLETEDEADEEKISG